MDPGRFYRDSRVVIVAGKGGVGKTTVSAVLAIAAARRGEDVLLFSLADPLGLPVLFGRSHPLTSQEATLYEGPNGGRVRGRLLLPDAILLEYLVDHGFRRIARRLGDSGVLDVVASAIPGIREVLVLGKLKQLERGDAASLFVLDAPASGHATRFLTSANGLEDAARSGPLRTQAEAAAALLADPERCQLVLVTIPEETPVNEVVETAFRVEDETGVTLGPLIVNDCLPVLAHLDTDPGLAAREAGVDVDPESLERLARAASFRRSRQDLQADQLERLATELPLPQIRLPHLFVPALGADGLLALADALDGGLEKTQPRPEGRREATP
jgi:anion-transporting  ArsA/GET3 family ATPase